MHQRLTLLRNQLKSRILVLDGAMGTAIQARNLGPEDFGGADKEGCNEALTLTRPAIIQSIHEAYLEAGCDIVETNTFGATPMVLGEYGLQDQCHAINRRAAELARAAAAKFDSAARPIFIAGSVGPTTKALSVTGGITFEQLRLEFQTQIRGLVAGGIDYILLETCQDTRNIKAALLALDDVASEIGQSISAAVSGTIEPMGTMLAGQTAEALYTSLEHRDLLYIGLNCATGPEFMTDSIRALAAVSRFPIACIPNAGLPDEDGCYLETPKMMCDILRRFIDQGWINFIGGCCGTTAPHIRAFSELAKTGKPRQATLLHRSTLSGTDFLEVTSENRPVLVGERTNSIGSKKFRDLIAAGDWDSAAEVARTQAKNGAQIIDICLANPERNEIEDMRIFLEIASKKIRAPLMIDSTDAEVIRIALTYSQGKAVINSINLEDGEERFEQVVPLAKQMGAALVVGTIDEDPVQGMGVSRERKLEIATREYDLLTKKYGVSETDIYWDPLVFPCATGDAQYVGSALETIEGLRLIKSKYPHTRSVLGISNVSFGLPASGREVLNSIFLYHCVQAGLDLAIVNSEKLVRYAQIPQEEKDLSEDLLFNRRPDAIDRFAAHFREKKVQASSAPLSDLPLDERLAQAVIQGTKEGLQDNLQLKLKECTPLEVINGPLMKGMDEVGRLFNQNQLIVAEVLQSAEVMKAAVSFLEPFMDRDKTSSRGKVLLATVKGDVHDIGKNLVDIILSNNGFQVINLGIRVPPEVLIAESRKHSPDILGLSGLLVKSAQQMVFTAEDLSKSGVTPRMLVGGAALSENFVDRKIAPAYQGDVSYASDAMHGLELAKIFVDEGAFQQWKEKTQTRRTEKANAAARPKLVQPSFAPTDRRSSEVKHLPEPPNPGNFERHVLLTTPVEILWPFINPLMLYGRHLGMGGKTIRDIEKLRNQPSLRGDLDAKSLKIWETVEEVKLKYKGSEFLKPSAVYQFFRAESEGNILRVYPRIDAPKGEAEVFEFPRQAREQGVCLADFTWQASESNAERFDNVCFFTTSVGKGLRDHALQLKDQGKYLESHVLQALAIESAEAFAEYLHSKIRKTWGFPDPVDMTMMQRFQAKYQGKRYSFGYPACPRLDDQTQLFRLLRPESIGVELTDGFMMDPEASVSAIVFHHPDAHYFSAGTGADVANDARMS